MNEHFTDTLCNLRDLLLLLGSQRLRTFDNKVQIENNAFNNHLHSLAEFKLYTYSRENSI